MNLNYRMVCESGSIYFHCGPSLGVVTIRFAYDPQLFFYTSGKNDLNRLIHKDI